MKKSFVLTNVGYVDPDPGVASVIDDIALAVVTAKLVEERIRQLKAQFGDANVELVSSEFRDGVRHVVFNFTPKMPMNNIDLVLDRGDGNNQPEGH